MNRIRAPIVVILGVAALASAGAQPITKPVAEPAHVETFSFIDGYRITHYLQAAEELQKLDAEKRIARLKELAVDPKRGSEVFPLCRMLFEAKSNAKFRRPLIGEPVFVGGGHLADWELEPITLFDQVPILIVEGYNLAGYPEPPLSYVDYCLKECKWSDTKYVDVGTARLKGIVDKFITAHPELKGEAYRWHAANWIRAQAE